MNPPLDYLPRLPRRKDFRIGCIGAGFIMRDCHLVAYRQAGFNPVAIASRTPARAQAVAQQHNIPRCYDTIDELLALQHPDGGWSQLPDTTSDAYATGQTLYVLSLTGYTAERPELKRAIDLLVATQKPDGSWPMTSRSTPDGSPGSAKLLTPITCAGSAWATLGLTRLTPKGP